MIDGLAGKRLGLRKTLRQLEVEPCALDAYRLQGVLYDKLCGYHLSYGYRLCFSFLDEDPEGGKNTVVVIYVGQKDPEVPDRNPPIWQLVHELFDAAYTSGGAEREHCCAEGRPSVSEDEVIEVMDRLQRALRRR